MNAPQPNKPPPPPSLPAPAPVVDDWSKAPPTFLKWSEAKAVLMQRGGLTETEARNALHHIPTAKVPGDWKKWHRLRVEEYSDNIRRNGDATLEAE